MKDSLVSFSADENDCTYMRCDLFSLFLFFSFSLFLFFSFSPFCSFPPFPHLCNCSFSFPAQDVLECCMGWLRYRYATLSCHHEQRHAAGIRPRRRAGASSACARRHRLQCSSNSRRTWRGSADRRQQGRRARAAPLLRTTNQGPKAAEGTYRYDDTGIPRAGGATEGLPPTGGPDDRGRCFARVLLSVGQEGRRGGIGQQCGGFQ